MQSFSYAKPQTTKEAVDLLRKEQGRAAVLAGGTDLLSLMKDSVVSPSVLVNLKGIDALSGIRMSGETLHVGATTTLSELLADRTVGDMFPALLQAVRGVTSPQIRNMGTVGGDLCQRPRCWYFRKGHGLVPMHNGSSMVKAGDNRFHAILGNSGAAQFVNPSSLAPALIALGAQVRITGAARTRTVALADFFQTPTTPDQKEYALAPDEIVVGVRIPTSKGRNATYEVRHRDVLDWPLAAAGVSLSLSDRGTVRASSVVLGHVAPVPWISESAARFLKGKRLTAEVAEQAGEAALVAALPLSMNKYKVQLARVATKRAILRAAGMES